MKYPEILSNLIEDLKMLPGVGEKTAERYAFSLLEKTKEDRESFITSVKNLDKLRKCSICNYITEDEICSICSDKSRNNKILCVVEDAKTVLLFEKMGTFKGQYHVLNGLISPIDNIRPEDLNIPTLIKRVIDGGHTEVILAIKSTIEGETTSSYIKRLLKDSNVLVTRIANGIPIGAEIDNIDSMTLEMAFENRNELV